MLSSCASWLTRNWFASCRVAASTGSPTTSDTVPSASGGGGGGGWQLTSGASLVRTQSICWLRAPYRAVRAAANDTHWARVASTAFFTAFAKLSLRADRAFDVPVPGSS